MSKVTFGIQKEAFFTTPSLSATCPTTSVLLRGSAQEAVWLKLEENKNIPTDRSL